MISAKHTTLETIKELRDGYSKACYWFLKKNGGMRALEEKRKEMLKRSVFAKAVEPIEYTDPNKNKWLIYDYLAYDNGVPYVSNRAIVYHDTVASCGVFIISDKKTVLHFTEHFFLRFCERLGVEYDSKAMLKVFVEKCSQMYCSEEDGKFTGVISGGSCYGVVKECCGCTIYEARTFIAESQLGTRKRQNADSLKKEKAENDDGIRKITDLANSIGQGANFLVTTSFGITSDVKRKAMIKVIKSETMKALKRVVDGFSPKYSFEMLGIASTAAATFGETLDLERCIHMIDKNYRGDIEKEFREYGLKIKRWISTKQD